MPIKKGGMINHLPLPIYFYTTLVIFNYVRIKIFNRLRGKIILFLLVSISLISKLKFFFFLNFMLRIKLIKNKRKGSSFFRMEVLDNRKKFSKNSISIGYLDRISKVLCINFKYVLFYLSSGVTLSKGIIKLIKSFKNPLFRGKYSIIKYEHK